MRRVTAVGIVAADRAAGCAPTQGAACSGRRKWNLQRDSCSFPQRGPAPCWGRLQWEVGGGGPDVNATLSSLIRHDAITERAASSRTWDAVKGGAFMAAGKLIGRPFYPSHLMLKFISYQPASRLCCWTLRLRLFLLGELWLDGSLSVQKCFQLEFIKDLNESYAMCVCLCVCLRACMCVASQAWCWLAGWLAGGGVDSAE